MTILFFHGPAAPREKYEAALGGPYTVVFPPGASLSASYDERSGLARTPLPAVLDRYAPGWSQPLVLLAFSAGNWAVRHWLRDPANRELVACFVSIDGLHGESMASLGGVLEFARMCEADPARHRLVVTNSDIDPIKYASTDDGSAWLLDELGVQRERRDHWTGGRGVFVVDDPGDNRTAAGHVAQLQKWGVEACATYVRPWLEAMRPTEPPPPSVIRAPWLDASLGLGERALLLALHEAESEPVPTGATLAKYLAGCERAGAPGLGAYLKRQAETGSRPNHCAAAASWCAFRVDAEGVPHKWRAGAKELRADAIAAHAWHEASEARAGVWLPSRGDLAIYDRSQPGKPETSWWGHVDRVQSVAGDGFENVGANELARGGWRAGQFTPFETEKLLGFIAYPAAPSDPPQEPPRHLLSPEQIKIYTAARDASIAATIAEAPWRPAKDGG